MYFKLLNAIFSLIFEYYLHDFTQSAIFYSNNILMNVTTIKHVTSSTPPMQLLL